MKKTTIKPSPNPYMDYINAQQLLYKKHLEAEKQAELDFQKWIESENTEHDLSGKMPYCQTCDFCDSKSCGLPSNLRVKYRICAKALKRSDK